MRILTKLDIRNNTESNFKLAKPFPKKYLKSSNGQLLRQLWMSEYYTWHLKYGTHKILNKFNIKHAPSLPDNFPTLHKNIEKWDEWETTYDTWFNKFVDENIMK